MKLCGIFLSTVAATVMAVVGIAQAQIVSIPIPGSPLTLSVMANPQPLQELKNNPAATAHNLGDDGSVGVSLPFTFPFYNQNFTNSTMYSNGAVQFGASQAAANNSFCCAGLQLSRTMGAQYNHSIMPLWTDLIGAEGNNHYTLGTANSMTYGWYGVKQYGTNNRSSFELKVDSTGGIDMRWAGALVTAHPVTIGTIGNAAQGEFTQNYFSTTGINIPGLAQLSTGILTSENIYSNSYAINQALSLSGVQIHGYNYGYTVNFGPGWYGCTATNQDGSCSWYMNVNPSASVSAKVTDSNNAVIRTDTRNYSGANSTNDYSFSVNLASPRAVETLGNFSFGGTVNGNASVTNKWSNWKYSVTDACATDPLSSPGCDGYAAAYLAQQCTANVLYDSACPGYAAAFFTQQCAATALYNPACPGYAAAYQAQQCSLSPLYSSNCPGYAVAYKTQQCSLDALYASDCPGYAQAYKTRQCSLNPLYASDCPGYQQAYLNAQCIQDSLYSRQCEGYNTAYAVKYLTPLNSSVTTAVNSSLSTTAVTQARDVAARINTDGSVSTTPQLISDSTVNSVLTSRPDTTSASSPTSVLRPANNAPGSVNPVGNLQPGGGGAPAPAANQMAQRQEERKSEEKKTDNAVAAVEKEVGSKSDNKSDSKSDNKSGGGRPENREKVREAMTARAKELASDMSRAATLEAQTANQAVVLGLIGYVPGFSAYQNSQVPDSLGQAVARQYGRAAVDNRGAQRGLSVANDRLHQRMVESQYK